jgi:hypothetical protein
MFVKLTFNQDADSNDINTVAKSIESIISVITSANPAAAPVDATVISGVEVYDTTPAVWYADGGRRRGSSYETLPDSDPVQVGDRWVVRNTDYPNPDKLLHFRISETINNDYPTKYIIAVGNFPHDPVNYFVTESKPVNAIKIFTGEDYIAFIARPTLTRIVHI